MALRAVIDHPKFANLKRVLGLPRWAALGILESLWHFTGRFTPAGNIGKYSDDEIEAWCEWDGEPGMLVDALVQCRWIDKDPTHRLLVHDWDKHADDATKLAVKRSNIPFAVPTLSLQNPSLSLQCRDTVSNIATTSGLPEPEPVPEPVDPPKAIALTPRGSRFTKPTLEELQTYMAELGLPPSFPQKFLDHYDARNWKLSSGVKMSDWKAACRTWKHMETERQTSAKNGTHKAEMQPIKRPA